MSQVPLVLAGVLAVLAFGTLAHLLVSSIRRRRRDIAILKTLGFEKRQARGVILWQAGIFVSVVLAIAVPLGVVVGRLTWNVIAPYGGFDPAPVVPLGRFGLVCLAAMVVALAIALLPARAAARTPRPTSSGPSNGVLADLPGVLPARSAVPGQEARVQVRER